MTNPAKKERDAAIMTICTTSSKESARRMAEDAALSKSEAVKMWEHARSRRAEKRALGHGKPYRQVLRRAVDAHRYRELQRAIDRAGFRTAKHGHSQQIGFGVPNAYSHSDRMSSWQAGMSNAYCRRAYTVATSHHDYTFAESWIRDVKMRGIAVLDGILTLGCEQIPDLSADPGGRAYKAVWARQGVGTTIVCERGWLVSLPNDQWYHAQTPTAIARLLAPPKPAIIPSDLPLEQLLELDPQVRQSDVRRAGACRPGIQDFAERYLGGSTRPVRASALWSAALRATPAARDYIEKAIRLAAGRDASRS